jgi:hypothetical protein
VERLPSVCAADLVLLLGHIFRKNWTERIKLSWRASRGHKDDPTVWSTGEREWWSGPRQVRLRVHSQFAPAAGKAIPDDVDQLGKTGQAILELLHRAADVAEANRQHALDMAEKLSHQLRAVEDWIAALQAEMGIYQEKADRAERWLLTVYTEIEDRFLRNDLHGRPATRARAQGRRSLRRGRVRRGTDWIIIRV